MTADGNNNPSSDLLELREQVAEDEDGVFNLLVYHTKMCEDKADVVASKRKEREDRALQ